MTYDTAATISSVDETAATETATSPDRRAARMALQRRIDDKFVKTRKVEEMVSETEILIDSMMTTIEGKHPEGRILAVVGEPGAGKTWAVQHALRKTLTSRDLLLETTAPAPCTPKTLGRNLLFALDYELVRDLPEHIVWERVRAQLKASGKRIVWVDEMHHALTSTDCKELTKVSETLKNLVQQRDWPVSLVLSGRAKLSTFIGRDLQLERRSQTVFFDPVDPEAKDESGERTMGEYLRDLMMNIIVGQAEMHAGKLLTDEFVKCVCYAAEYGMGNIITLTRQAIYRAFDRAGEGATVTNMDFAMVYRRLRGAEDDQNVFLVPNWHQIVVRNSRLRDKEEPDADASSAKKKPKKGAK